MEREKETSYNLPIFSLDFLSETKEVSIFYSLYVDFEFAISSLNRLKGLLEKNHQDDTILQSLWISSLITYVRCFARGKQFGLDESIYENLPDNPIAAHQYYKNLCDKYMSFSENPFEQYAFGTMLSSTNPEKAQRKDVKALSKKYLSNSLDKIITLIGMSMVAHMFCKKKYDHQMEKLKKAVKKTPMDKLVKQKQLFAAPHFLHKTLMTEELKERCQRSMKE